ncbi:hypothetical protein [Actinomycetospora flava]|uniref:Uncharacterized protein n=1 Tax=Actinomycetospora flava TaxID=3129232 RepID=A0ABU8M5H3_9PSEU
MTGVAAATTTRVIGALAVPVLMEIAMDALVGSATLAPGVALVLSHPVTATEIGAFVAWQTVQVARGRGSAPSSYS